jgi:hypothetical protein
MAFLAAAENTFESKSRSPLGAYRLEEDFGLQGSGQSNAANHHEKLSFN